MIACPSREKVLLNLKWFFHRLLKSFEAKLQKAVSCDIDSGTLHPNSDTSLFVLTNAKLNSDHSLSNEGLPSVRQLLEQQFKRGVSKKITQAESYSQNDISVPRKLSNHERSPLMRIRSLTNSPLFRRLSLTGSITHKKSLLYSDENYDWISQNNNENIKLTENIRNGGKFANRNCVSNTHSPNFSLVNRCTDGRHVNHVFYIYKTTTETQRQRLMSSLAQQMCIIYEYQIGMLRGLSAIHAAADYVAETLIKAIKLGKIIEFNEKYVSPAILFESDCRPSSSSKIVKTSPLSVTGEQLSWRLGEMWTLPGLRHNEVGGENCHNLSIVTHFLSAVNSTGDASRTDIYGYRNLILLLNKSQNTPTHETSIMTKTFSEKNHDRNTNNYDSFDIFTLDYETLKNSKVKPGTTHDDDASSNSISGESLSEEQVGKQTPNNCSSNSVKSISKRVHPASSAAMLRQHLHRAYRPVFFLIYNRPSVIEHLTECDSFATFCKKQSLSPVMFLNQSTTIFDDKPYPCIYQNFDLFKITVTGYGNANENDKHETSSGDLNLQNTNYLLNRYFVNNGRNLMSFPYFSRKSLAAYDNPGFDR